MKIVHIAYSGLGGVLSIIDSFVNSLDIENEQFVTYVGPSITTEALKHKKKLSKNNFLYIKTIKYFSIFYFYKIFLKLIKIKPNIIILHNFQIIPCILIKIFHHTKIIFVDHQSTNTKNYKDNIILSTCRFMVDHFVVLNNDNYKLLNNKFNIEKKRISIIPNGVNLKFYKKIINNKNNKNKKILKIGMAARINSKRCHRLIINAVNSRALEHISINCSFAGEGELKEELKDIVRDKTLNKKFFFNDNLNKYELRKWYSNLDLYIQASKGEGLSISVLQGMALGIPVLGSNVSGIKNILNEKNNIGILFENNKKSLAHKIKYFYFMNYNQRKKISKNQKIIINEKYSENMMINRYNKLFKLINNN